VIRLLTAAAPAEIEFGWVYLPPALFAILFGIVVASVLGSLLNRTGLSRFFWKPPLAWLAFVVIAASLFGLLVLPP
jgi:uncharacterized membrane protein YraQ (UPF0718 family)